MNSLLIGGYLFIIGGYVVMISLDKDIGLACIGVGCTFLVASNGVETKTINDKLDTIIKQLNKGDTLGDDNKDNGNDKQSNKSISGKVNNKTNVENR